MHTPFLAEHISVIISPWIRIHNNYYDFVQWIFIRKIPLTKKRGFMSPPLNWLPNKWMDAIPTWSCAIKFQVPSTLCPCPRTHALLMIPLWRSSNLNKTLNRLLLLSQSSWHNSDNFFILIQDCNGILLLLYSFIVQILYTNYKYYNTKHLSLKYRPFWVETHIWLCVRIVCIIIACNSEIVW